MFAKKFVIVGLCLMVGVAMVVSARDQETCLNEIEQKLSVGTIPKPIQDLANGLRGLNPSLSNLSLTKLVDSKSAETSGLVDKGLIRASELDELAETCATFIEQSYEMINSVEGCQEVTVVLMNPVESAKYDALVDQTRHAKIDEVVGHERVCLLI